MSTLSTDPALTLFNATNFPNASTTTPKLTGHRPVATNTHLIGYAAFFSPDSAPRIFFIHAEKRWRFCSRRTTASLITQLN